MSNHVYLSGKEANKVRSILRKALKQGHLLIRQTYYDYYDSCEAPLNTPDAPFVHLKDFLRQDFFESEYIMAIWYKKDETWTKFMDCNDYWSMLQWMNVLRTILGEKAIIKYF